MMRKTCYSGLHQWGHYGDVPATVESGIPNHIKFRELSFPTGPPMPIMARVHATPQILPNTGVSYPIYPLILLPYPERAVQGADPYTTYI
eukprot:85285-Prorocentrum_minimum.AAC.3